MEHDLQELVGLERLGWQSLCDGTGSAFYEALIVEEGLMVLANGMTMSRAMSPLLSNPRRLGLRSRSRIRVWSPSAIESQSWSTSELDSAAKAMPSLLP